MNVVLDSMDEMSVQKWHCVESHVKCLVGKHVECKQRDMSWFFHIQSALLSIFAGSMLFLTLNLLSPQTGPPFFASQVQPAARPLMSQHIKCVRDNTGPNMSVMSKDMQQLNHRMLASSTIHCPGDVLAFLAEL